MNATAALLAYGVRPNALGLTTHLLASGAYSTGSWELQMQAAHAACDLSTFCRNPLHPGPCKGWKKHLGIVAPGALHALEKARYEKLEEKRKAKVKALQDAGQKVPAALLKPIKYDPALNPHIASHGETPGEADLTPDVAKKNIGAIPTKAEVGAKLDAKHAAEAAAAVPKPTEKPQYLTVAKAGLKDGDQVFLHANVGGSLQPMLVTVRKYKVGKSTKYRFEDANGNIVKDAHGDPLTGGAASKYHFSPAPGKEFPKHEAAPAGPSGFEKGEQTKLDKLLNGNQGASAVKAHEKAQTITTAIALAGGKHASYDQQQQMIATIHHNDSLPDGHPGKKKAVMSDEQVTKLADAIGFKVATKIGPADSGGLTAPDFSDALHKELSHAIENGGDTPLLDAASDVTKMFGSEPGSHEKFVQLAKKILGKDAGEPAMPAEPKVAPGMEDSGLATHAKITNLAAQVKAAKDHEAATGVSTPAPTVKALADQLAELHGQLTTKPNATFGDHKAANKAAKAYQEITGLPIADHGKVQGADAFYQPIGSPNAGAAPHVKTAIDMANGFTSATDTKKLAAFEQLTPDELAALDPNTKQLMEASLHKMLKKFLDPKKKSKVQEVLTKVQVAKGGGAGAGGDVVAPSAHVPSAPSTPAPAHVPAGPDFKAQAQVIHQISQKVGAISSPDVAEAMMKDIHQNQDQAGIDTFVKNYGKSVAVKHVDSLAKKLGLDDTHAEKLDAGTTTNDLENKLAEEYASAIGSGTTPAGISTKIDSLVAEVNQVGDDLSAKNGWPKDGPAVQSFKVALAHAKIKDLLGSTPQAGAGGSSTHKSPSVTPTSAPPSLGEGVVHAKPPQGSKPGVILLKHAQALRVVKLMKSFPEGQYLESPEPKIWDNLVAISAHEGVTPMQALTTLDEQNAKKLGIQNKNLLEAKVRAWLATADGKAYAEANKTPKPHLVNHIKIQTKTHTEFTNKTGIDLPPGEKVQKIGGPGEFDPNKPASDFGNHDVATAEADQNKFKAAQGIKFSKKQLGALTEYVNGSGPINGWLRDQHTPSQTSIDNAIYLQSMMMPTQRDHYLLRGTGWTQFPPEARSYEGLLALVGETLEEPAFLSASVSKSSSGFGGPVKMHIQAPAGTMGVFTKDDQYHSQYLGTEAELLLAARTELKVLKVWKEGSQVQVLMRVVS